MTYKYEIPSHFRKAVSEFEDFANGGTQVTILVEDGRVFEKVLISNSTVIAAIRGFSDLPFRLDEILKIYQTDEDRNPSERGNWYFWDDWVL